MSVLIDTVRVAGFRGLCNTEITLNRVSILIGANNSGKTSLLKAIALALGDHSGRIVEEDFHIGPDDRKAEQILVDLRIVPTKDCVREPKFSNEWTTEFGDSIKQEADGNQFVAVRVRCVDDPIRGGYTIERSYLDKWPKFKVWKTDKVKRTKATRFENISFLPIEAQLRVPIP